MRGDVVTCTGGTLDGSANLIPDDVLRRRRTRTSRTTGRSGSSCGRRSGQASPSPTRPSSTRTNAIAESNETNNQAFENTTIESPFNLTLDKEGPNQASQNSEEDYDITVTNEGDAVNDVVVIDALPVGLDPAEHHGAAWQLHLRL